MRGRKKSPRGNFVIYIVNMEEFVYGSTEKPGGRGSRLAVNMRMVSGVACIRGVHWHVVYFLSVVRFKTKLFNIFIRGKFFRAWKGVPKSPDYLT